MHLKRTTAALITTAVTIGTATAITASPAIFPDLTPPDPTTSCIVVPSYSTNDATWSQLVEDGWVGDPTDSMEALHSPGCHIPADVTWPEELTK